MVHRLCTKEEGGLLIKMCLAPISDTEGHFIFS